jgi:hypothetical protein
VARVEIVGLPRQDKGIQFFGLPKIAPAVKCHCPGKPRVHCALSWPEDALGKSDREGVDLQPTAATFLPHPISVSVYDMLTLDTF